MSERDSLAERTSDVSRDELDMDDQESLGAMADVDDELLEQL